MRDKKEYIMGLFVAYIITNAIYLIQGMNMQLGFDMFVRSFKMTDA
jgi:hypothetical protein